MQFNELLCRKPGAVYRACYVIIIVVLRQLACFLSQTPRSRQLQKLCQQMPAPLPASAPAAGPAQALSLPAAFCKLPGVDDKEDAESVFKAWTQTLDHAGPTHVK